MTRCVCHPAHRCGRCLEQRDLSVQIIAATARDNNKEPCPYMTDDAMCVLRDGHQCDHKLERYDSVVPIH